MLGKVIAWPFVRMKTSTIGPHDVRAARRRPRDTSERLALGLLRLLEQAALRHVVDREGFEEELGCGGVDARKVRGIAVRKHF
jgi:hypothetical protein